MTFLPSARLSRSIHRCEHAGCIENHGVFANVGWDGDESVVDIV